MNSKGSPQKTALHAENAAPRKTSSNYPEPFATRMNDRIKRPLGDLFGLKNFGVNLTTLLPGSVSALHHQHLTQDEFIFVLSGNPTLFTDDGCIDLCPGMCAGFRAKGTAHHLENLTNEPVVILEIGDRTPADQVVYPQDDLVAIKLADGRWNFTKKDGTPYS